MTVRHRIEFWIFRVVSWKVAVLPERAALGLCSVLGWFVGVVLRVRRVDVPIGIFRSRFLSGIWPGGGRAARASYIHFAREAAMTIRLSRMRA